MNQKKDDNIHKSKALKRQDKLAKHLQCARTEKAEYECISLNKIASKFVEKQDTVQGRTNIFST